MTKIVTWLSIAISFVILTTSVTKADSRQLLSSFRDWDAFVLKTDAGENITLPNSLVIQKGIHMLGPKLEDIS